jgi:hypothetical protein
MSSFLKGVYLVEFYDGSVDPKCHQKDAILFETTRDCSKRCTSACKCNEIKTFPVELLIFNHNK